jgi:hypothetical protein
VSRAEKVACKAGGTNESNPYRPRIVDRRSVFRQSTHTDLGALQPVKAVDSAFNFQRLNYIFLARFRASRRLIQAMYQLK